MPQIENFSADEITETIDAVRDFLQREGNGITVLAATHTIGPDYAGNRTMHYYTVVYDYTGKPRE